MPGRHTGADNDLGSSDLEVLHVSESGSALAARRSGCLYHVVIYSEDHPAHRGEFLEACRVGGGGLPSGEANAARSSSIVSHSSSVTR